VAEDLIPPGREPGATQPAISPGATPPAIEPGATPHAGEAPAAPPRTRHARRVSLALGVLAGLAVLAGAVTVAALGGRSARDDPARGWSNWRPSSGGAGGAQQIADHVTPTYHLADGRQLVTATGGKLEVANLPVHVALRASAGSSRVSIVGGSAVMFTLCGLGPRCSIRTGPPSPQRMLLLRREALELALYSFRYLGVDNVVALLPPPPQTRAQRLAQARAQASGSAAAGASQPQGAALLFRRSELGPALSRPLGDTLPAAIPSVRTVTRAPEAALVSRVTAPSLFLVSIVQGQDASAYLVLDPPPRTG